MTNKTPIASAVSTAHKTDFFNVGAECERADLGAIHAVQKAAETIMAALKLKAKSVLDHSVWIETRQPFEAGYAKQYLKSRGLDGTKATEDDKTRASNAANTAATKVRAYLIAAGVVISQSESPDAKRKRDAREKKAKEQAILDKKVVADIRNRAKAQGIDEMMAALEVGQGNPVKTGKVLEALARVQKEENKAQEAENAATIKSLREQVRAKIKDADETMLRAMLAC